MSTKTSLATIASPGRIALLLLTFLSPNVKAQVDTEFWFAPPEVAESHGDAPLYLRISTLDQPATVRVSIPAQGIVAAIVQMAANATETVDLTEYKANLETMLPAQVLRTGLKVESTAPITTYYEVGPGANAEIFTLKGKNALGNRFVIPAQNLYPNDASYMAGNTFDIVASQDKTVVTIRPTTPFVGHENDTLITVKLNAGETYSLRKVGYLAQSNPAGTTVESNRPVAITLKDDSAIHDGCADLLGDQLVPVEVVGTEYIVLKGFLVAQEFLFLTAIEDGTHVAFNGRRVSDTLSAGEVSWYPIDNKSTYVATTHPVYALHVTGFGCELGMAILPAITCRGSSQIGFSRTSQNPLGLNILVRREGISNFTLNGSKTLVPASAFSRVPGTDSKWYAAQLTYTASNVPVGHASLIKNDKYSFQLGILNGDDATCSYGYFSSFATLFIGDDIAICEGEELLLDAGPEKESYQWNTGEQTRFITVNSDGEYWVRVVREDCVLYDTIAVSIRQGAVDLGPDVVICPGDTAKVDGKDNFSWQWSNGDTGRFLETTVPGKYWVSVFDNTGCQASDTIAIQWKETAEVDLGADVSRCPDDTVAFDVSVPGATYLWSDGTTSAQNKFHEAGQYWVKVFTDGCALSDTVVIGDWPLPEEDTIYGSPSVCPFSEEIDYFVDADPEAAYSWVVDGGDIADQSGEHILVNWHETRNDAIVSVLITNGYGCIGDSIHYAVRINPVLTPERPEGPDTVCLNKAFNVTYTTPFTNGSVYDWQISGGEVTSGQGSNEVMVNWQKGFNSLRIVESSTTIDTVCEGESPVLEILVFKDSTAIALKVVSVDTTNGSDVVVQWDFTGPSNQTGMTLQRNSGSEWSIATEVASTASTFRDVHADARAGPVFYLLALTNACDEDVVTDVHQTMFLTGVADTSANLITLAWNHYSAWKQGVDSYEVWRKLDDSPGLGFLARVSPAENSYSEVLTTDGFRHRYYIRAVDATGQYVSWSSPVDFEFKHPLFIPNIITPNGDGKNDVFIIRNIHLYPGSALTIYDRWGKKVYFQSDYGGGWGAEGLSAGVYYYTLAVNRDTAYKGWVNVVR